MGSSLENALPYLKILDSIRNGLKRDMEGLGSSWISAEQNPFIQHENYQKEKAIATSRTRAVLLKKLLEEELDIGLCYRQIYHILNC